MALQHQEIRISKKKSWKRWESNPAQCTLSLFKRMKHNYSLEEVDWSQPFVKLKFVLNSLEFRIVALQVPWRKFLLIGFKTWFDPFTWDFWIWCSNNFKALNNFYNATWARDSSTSLGNLNKNLKWAFIQVAIEAFCNEGSRAMWVGLDSIA